MSPIEVAYYQKRALEERAQASMATEPQAARVHAELAKRYEALIRRSPRVSLPSISETIAECVPADGSIKPGAAAVPEHGNG